MAAQSCSNTSHTELETKTQEEIPNVSELETKLSEIAITSTISHPVVVLSGDSDCDDEPNCDTQLPTAPTQPLVNVTNHSESHSGPKLNGTSFLEAPNPPVIVNGPSEDTIIQQPLADTKGIPTDLSKESVVENDAVPSENLSCSKNETCVKSCDSSKSSMTESAISNPSSLPVDEDDAGPFNQSAYRRHLKGGGGNICYETYTNKDSHYYDLSQGRKLALIFNHEEYNHYDHQNIPRRTGTRKDCEAITKVFDKIGFKVVQKDNLRVNEIKEEMMNIQKENNLACLALFILTHGEENGLLYGYDSNYRLDRHIIHPLLPQNCPSLAGKPKLIFVQACQGSETDDGITVAAKRIEKGQRSRHTSTDGASEYNSNVYCIPNYADLLVFQASYHGHYSFRSSSGSWFIQTLCKEVEASEDEEDLSSVLTRISRQVALLRQSNVPSDPTLHHKRQIPLKQDTLIRQIYLKRVPNAIQENGNDETSKIVDVDKAIESSVGASPMKKISNSLKRLQNPALPSTRSGTASLEEPSTAKVADKKKSKENCNIM